MQRTDARSLGGQLKDLTIFNVFQGLERGKTTNTFLRLYQAAACGELDTKQMFVELCSIMEDHLRHERSNNANAKYGIRYPQNYLNFMILLHSYGGSTARQYGILTSQLGGPSSRQLR